MENPRAVIGSNSAGLDEAIARFDLVGYLLVRHETLIRAAVDDRIDRACLKVLAILITTMNRETRTSWAGREHIAECTGMTAKSVSNYIYQLKCLGYIVSERRQTPQANNRVLMHYTLSKLSPDEIEAAIDNAISSIRGDRVSVVQFPPPREVKPESSRPDRNSQSQVPVQTGTQFPAPTGTQETSSPDGNATSSPDGKSIAEPLPSSRPDGRSISSLSNTKNRTSGERGTGREATKATRLPDDWELPNVWGRWAVDAFVVKPSEVRKQAALFKDYWIAQGGERGRKTSWEATWRNWCRRAFDGRERSTPANNDAPLLDQAGKIQAEAEAAERRKRQTEQLEAEGWEIRRAVGPEAPPGFEVKT